MKQILILSRTPFLQYASGLLPDLAVPDVLPLLQGLDVRGGLAQAAAPDDAGGALPFTPASPALKTFFSVSRDTGVSMSFRPSAIRPRSSLSEAFFLTPAWNASISPGEKRKQE